MTIERAKRPTSFNPIELIRILWNKLLYRTSHKRRAEEMMRTQVRELIKGNNSQMHKLGARLRIKQQVGKMKHAHKTNR